MTDQQLAADDDIEVLADRIHKENMEEMEREASMTAFYDILIKSGYLSSSLLVLIGLYYTWVTERPEVIVIFGSAAVLTVLVAANLRSKISDPEE